MRGQGMAVFSAGPAPSVHSSAYSNARFYCIAINSLHILSRWNKTALMLKTANITNALVLVVLLKEALPA